MTVKKLQNIVLQIFSSDLTMKKPIADNFFFLDILSMSIFVPSIQMCGTGKKAESQEPIYKGNIYKIIKTYEKSWYLTVTPLNYLKIRNIL